MKEKMWSFKSRNRHEFGEWNWDEKLEPNKGDELSHGKNQT